MKCLKFLLTFILLMMPLTNVSAELKEITLKADGKVLKTDVAPVIINGRTLVPVRVISETNGARVVWDGTNRVVKITSDKIEINLQIDSKKAIVNKKEVELDVPAQIISDRTMVPVRFVAESFGYIVGWSGETRTVSLTSPKPEKEPEKEPEEETEKEPEEETEKENAVVSLVTIGSSNTEKGYRITIKFDGKIKNRYKMFELENPQRLIVDFENAQVDYTKKFEFKNETIVSARAGNHDGYMRVVIDMEEPATYKTYLSEKEDALVIFFDVESDEPIVKDTTAEEDKKEDEKEEEKEDKVEEEAEQIKIEKPKSLEELVVVIDAGHGGSDPGALGKEDGEIVARESEINLAVALLVQEYLEDEGITVIMTRDDDSRVSLGERCIISNEGEAHLFVSIHSNAMDVGKEHINGTMVFYGKEKDNDKPWIKSKSLASNILEELCDALDTANLDVQNGDQLAVVRGTFAPAVLVELGFITNVEDREKITSKKYQKKAAKAIAEAIINSVDLD